MRAAAEVAVLLAANALGAGGLPALGVWLERRGERMAGMEMITTLVPEDAPLAGQATVPDGDPGFSSAI